MPLNNILYRKYLVTSEEHDLKRCCSLWPTDGRMLYDVKVQWFGVPLYPVAERASLFRMDDIGCGP